MAKRVENAHHGTPSAHTLKHDENVPELHDESIEEDSEEEEFPPEDVEYEPSQDSRFSTRGPADARAVSLSTARAIQDKEKAKNNQNQINSQTVSQIKSSTPARQIDANRYSNTKK